MWALEIVGGVVAVLATTGVVLNNRRMRACFYLWMVSNALSAGLHAHAGLIAMVIRDLVFLILAIEGAYKWRKDSPIAQGLPAEELLDRFDHPTESPAPKTGGGRA